MENEIKQRLFDLNVDEISLVDKPANEMEILIMKRQEGPDRMEKSMDSKTTNTVGTATNYEQSEIEIIKVDETSEDKDTVTKALDSVASIVKDVTKAACNNIDSETETHSEENCVAIETEKSNVESDKTIETALFDIEKSLTEKISTVSESIVNLQNVIDSNVKTNGDTEIEKSITADKLNKSFETLTAMIQKSLDGQKELSDRIEVIESSRIPSQSIDEDIAIRKQENNIWEGIF